MPRFNLFLSYSYHGMLFVHIDSRNYWLGTVQNPIYTFSLNYLQIYFILTSILWKREGGLERFNKLSSVSQLESSKTQAGPQHV